MIAQDEIICRLAEGKLQGIEEGRTIGLAEGRSEGRAEGRAEGHAEGESLKNRELAKGFRDDGVPLDIISKRTGLTPEEIKAL